MFNFTPLLGAQSTSPASQSLLELDGGIKILVDVGWDESFDPEKLKALEKQVPSISVILLTHATPAHLGAFAHCCKHIPLFTRIPIYATNPVQALGQTLLLDLYASTPLAASIIPQTALTESAYSYEATKAGNNANILLTPPTEEEIRRYFALVHPLKYSQPHQPLPSPFSPPLNGLTVTAYNAGHTLGGTIWHIQHGLESIVYAVDWNQAKEHVLAGAAWLGGGAGAEVIEPLRRPTALVCGARGAERIALAGGMRKRDEVLLNHIKETIAKDGTVLIPSDSSARVLELAFLLENAWHSAKPGDQDQGSIRKANLHFMSSMSTSTMRSARAMLEWMEESMVREFEAADQNMQNNKNNNQRTADAANEDKPSSPFDFKFMTLLESKRAVRRALSRKGPKVILGSDLSLEWGCSREVFRSIASDSRHLVILTDRLGQQTRNGKGVGRHLWELWHERQRGEDEVATVVDAQGAEVILRNGKINALGTNDLPIYQRYLARQRQMQENLQATQGPTIEAAADVVDDASSATSSSSEESNAEHQGKALNAAATTSHSRNQLLLSDAELGINILVRRKGIYDYEVRGKKGRDKVFPFIPKRKRFDDFGDLIRPDDYLRAEERDEIDGEDMRDGAPKKGAAVGEKRKWGDVATRSAAAGGRRASNGTNKRQRTGRDATNGKARVHSEESETEGSDPDDEEEEVTPEGPLKVDFMSETLQLNLRIAYVDFSGLADRRSIQMLIPLIRPRKLILIGGEKEETETIAADCRQLLGSGSGEADSTVDVFTPIEGRTIDASVDTNAWTVKLTQSLFKRLHWQNVRGLGVVALTARLEPAAFEDDEEAAEGTINKKLKMLKSDASDTSKSHTAPTANGRVASTPLLDIVPASMAGATRTVAQPLHVGDLRLADLRRIMQSSGYSAEFRGEGTLLINGMVAVRKSGTGRIEVEGAISSLGAGRDPTFYDVKRKIYDGLAVVAGG